MNNIKPVLFAAAAVSLAACVFGCTANAVPESTDHNSSAVRASEPTADISGTWMFDLDASDVAAPIREKCAAEAKGDTTKQTACWNEISAEAKQEMVRFSKIDQNGHAIWSSFASDGKKEILFLEAPVNLSNDGSGHVLAKVAGPAKGQQAEMFAKSSTSQIRIDVVNDKVIVINDPKKGRLVYSKQQ
jgi:hypothetical protein